MAAVLLIVLFLLTATLVFTLGTFTVVPREGPEVVRTEHTEVVGLFLDARKQAVPVLGDLGSRPGLESVNRTLTEGLIPVLHRARSLGVQANLSLAGPPSAQTPGEASLVDTAQRYRAGLHDAEGGTCYGLVPYDEGPDGLLHDEHGRLMASLLRIEVTGPRITLSEPLLVDNAAVDVAAPCTG